MLATFVFPLIHQEPNRLRKASMPNHIVNNLPPQNYPPVSEMLRGARATVKMALHACQIKKKRYRVRQLGNVSLVLRRAGAFRMSAESSHPEARSP